MSSSAQARQATLITQVVKGKHAYKTDAADQLSFAKEEILYVVAQKSAWYMAVRASNITQRGWIPSNYIAVLENHPAVNTSIHAHGTTSAAAVVAAAEASSGSTSSSSATTAATAPTAAPVVAPVPPDGSAVIQVVRALYPFKAQAKDQLSFAAQEILSVIRQKSGWWKAVQAGGATGWIPSNYVQVVQNAVSPTGNSVLPPVQSTPGSEVSTARNDKDEEKEKQVGNGELLLNESAIVRTPGTPSANVPSFPASPLTVPPDDHSRPTSPSVNNENANTTTNTTSTPAETSSTSTHDNTTSTEGQSTNQETSSAAEGETHAASTSTSTTTSSSEGADNTTSTAVEGTPSSTSTETGTEGVSATSASSVEGAGTEGVVASVEGAAAVVAVSPDSSAPSSDATAVAATAAVVAEPEPEAAPAASAPVETSDASVTSDPASTSDSSSTSSSSSSVITPAPTTSSLSSSPSSTSDSIPPDTSRAPELPPMFGGMTPREGLTPRAPELPPAVIATPRVGGADRGEEEEDEGRDSVGELSVSARLKQMSAEVSNGAAKKGNREKVQALFNFTALKSDQLSFKKHDIMCVVKKKSGWLKVYHVGRENVTGYIPANYVKTLDENDPSAPAEADTEVSRFKPLVVKATHTYKATSNNQLSFVKNEILHVVLKNNKGWWKACRPSESDKIGYIPANYVKVVEQVDNNTSTAAAAAAAAATAASNNASASTSGSAAASTSTEDVYEAAYAHTATDKKCLSFAKGDQFLKVREVGQGWWLCKKRDKEEQGLVPAHFLKVIAVASNAASTSPAIEKPAVPGPRGSDDAKKETFFAESTYAFKAKKPTQLSFVKYEMLIVLKKGENQWWQAKNAKGETGLIPSNYVKELPSSTVASFVALFDYDAQKSEELSLKKDGKLVVLNREYPNWWLARDESGREGWVPSVWLFPLSSRDALTPPTPRAPEPPVIPPTPRTGTTPRVETEKEKREDSDQNIASSTETSSNENSQLEESFEVTTGSVDAQSITSSAVTGVVMSTETVHVPTSAPAGELQLHYVTPTEQADVARVGWVPAVDASPGPTPRIPTATYVNPQSATVTPRDGLLTPKTQQPVSHRKVLKERQANGTSSNNNAALAGAAVVGVGVGVGVAAVAASNSNNVNQTHSTTQHNPFLKRGPVLDEFEASNSVPIEAEPVNTSQPSQLPPPSDPFAMYGSYSYAPSLAPQAYPGAPPPMNGLNGMPMMPPAHLYGAGQTGFYGVTPAMTDPVAFANLTPQQQQMLLMQQQQMLMMQQMGYTDGYYPQTQRTQRDTQRAPDTAKPKEADKKPIQQQNQPRNACSTGAGGWFSWITQCGGTRPEPAPKDGSSSAVPKPTPGE